MDLASSYLYKDENAGEMSQFWLKFVRLKML